MQATQEEMERKEGEMLQMVERMKQQEEEMRQNMEEMEATQEQMEYQNKTIAEKSAETQGILDGINATMATIEFTPEGNVINANENFLTTMKTTLSEIHGKHHSGFVPVEIKNSEEYKTFWSDLAKGIEKKGEFKRINALGETVWLNAIYNPIKNAAGEVVKVIKFATDITQQKEQEAQSKAQTDIINDIAIVSKTDLQGNITYVNDEFLKWSKYTLEEVMGKNHRMLKSGDQDDQIFVDMWKTISSGKIFRGEIKNKAKDGSFYWVDAIVAPVLGEDGKPKEYLAQRFVINEQKEKEQETGAQKAILDQICIISKTDLQGNITYVNDEFLKWSKYTKEEVMGKNHRMLKSGDQDDQIFVDMWKTISSGKIFRGEIKNKAKDGSFYWVDAIIAPVLDDKGKPVEYMAQRFVINEQKEKEQETGAQKAILDQICIISKTDLQGNITYVNDEFLKWSKYTKEEVMGKNHRMLKSGDQDDQIFVDMWKTISSGKIFRGDIKNKAKDGSFYWVDAIIAPVLDDKGKPVEYMAQRFVINEQKEKEEKLSELFKKLNNKD
jgi:PAS domain S-box-containing protein